MSLKRANEALRGFARIESSQGLPRGHVAHGWLLRFAAAAALLASLMSCTLLGVPTVATESELTRAINCFPASWNRLDMDAFGKCFTSDADFVNVTGAWWQGRDAIQKNHAFLLGTIDVTARGVTLPIQTYGVFRNSSFAFTSTHVRSLRGDLSVVHASWRIANEARAAKPRIGLMTMVLTRDTGVWRFAAVHNTEVDRSTP